MMIFIYYNLMVVSEVKAIRTICKRVTATPYKNKSPYSGAPASFKINYDSSNITFKKIHRGYYTVARRSEFYFRVSKQRARS